MLVVTHHDDHGYACLCVIAICAASAQGRAAGDVPQLRGAGRAAAGEEAEAAAGAEAESAAGAKASPGNTRVQAGKDSKESEWLGWH